MSELIKEIPMHEVTVLRELVKKYEAAFDEILNQNHLEDFLNENEWATTEDYLCHVVYEVLEL